MEIYSNELQKQTKPETKGGHNGLAPFQCPVSKQSLSYLLFQDNKFVRMICSLNMPLGVR